AAVNSTSLSSQLPKEAARKARFTPGPSLWVFLPLVAFYCVLGFVVLVPAVFYSGDIGVKFVQARALAAHHFTSLDIPYPGEFLDRSREFFPLRDPFVMTIGGATQAIFSPTFAVLQACVVTVAGFRGLALLSLL